MPRPIVELHVHLEGSVAPDLLCDLADRHGRPDVTGACLVPDGSRYRDIHGFVDFLQLFKAVSAVIVTPADHHAVALALAASLAAQNVQYAEITLAYGVLQKRGRDPLPIQRALAEAADEALATHGIHLCWLPDAVRQWGPDAAWAALESACRAGRDLGVVGFGLGGDESAMPVSVFASHFREARSEGLGTTCHAGETGGPDAVRDAILTGGVTRVGHALGAARSPEVLALMAARNIHAELCPGSNAATGVIEGRGAHPLRTFLAAGVPCSLHTDDPALFRTSLRGEYEAARRHLGLDEMQAGIMVRDALDASFAGEDLKREIGLRLAADVNGSSGQA